MKQSTEWVKIKRNKSDAATKSIGEDAARVDDCSEFQVIWYMGAPLAKPLIGLLLFLIFAANWNNYFLPFVMLNSSELFNLSVGIQAINDRYASASPQFCRHNHFNPSRGGGSGGHSLAVACDAHLHLRSTLSHQRHPQRNDERIGVTRLAYTPEYRQAEAMVRGWMEEAGLSVRTDAVGNLIGRREGTQPGRPCVMLASHIDTVINGGRYDGALGVLSAIETVQAMYEDGISLDAPLEVVAFMDEEGARWKGGLCGSRAMAAELSDNDLQRRDADQTSMAEAMQDWGLDPARLHEAIRDPSEIGSYLELHIEQGAVLESEGLAVGVVTGIAGLLLFSARLHGSADHAGATPMGPLRRDAPCWGPPNWP